nr:3-hydroxyacyl-ACP dehydratase FabZ [uncultured Desulfobacter sp.]
MKYLYDADAINRMIPQKYPFSLVDRVVSHKPGKSIICIKNVTQNEAYFVGHFPDRKIMPGVLICEALAQTCALLGVLDAKAKKDNGPNGDRAENAEPAIGFLASVNLKFMNPVTPGDQLFLRAISSKEFGGLKAFEVEALSDKEVACKGVIKTTLRKEEIS